MGKREEAGKKKERKKECKRMTDAYDKEGWLARRRRDTGTGRGRINEERQEGEQSM